VATQGQVRRGLSGGGRRGRQRLLDGGVFGQQAEIAAALAQGPLDLPDTAVGAQFEGPPRLGEVDPGGTGEAEERQPVEPDGEHGVDRQDQQCPEQTGDAQHDAAPG
jgi:hypothetical protein